MIRVTGVNDEPSKDWNLDAGLDALDELGVKFVELRAVDKKNVDDLTEAEFDRVEATIAARGFSVTGYDSNLGKCELALDNWPVEEGRMNLAIARATRLGSPLIRTMGYRRGDCTESEWRERTFEWLSRLAGMAAAAQKTVVLENCLAAESSLGSAPRDCLEIMQTVNSPHLRLNLDPGNFAFYGHDAFEGFELLRDYIANVHVKDWQRPGEQRSACLAGDGIAKWPEILRGLRDMDYSGCATIEPHMRMYESYHYSGHADYVRAGKRLLQLLDELGIKADLG